jgi:hypothetical protein
MCLSRITKRIDQPTDDVVKAWKIFNSNAARTCLTALYQHIDYKKRTGKWTGSRKVKLYLNEGETYITGFHAFRYKKHAIDAISSAWLRRSAILIPVELRKVTTLGIDHDVKAIVAREMFIPKNWKELAIDINV